MCYESLFSASCEEHVWNSRATQASSSICHQSISPSWKLKPRKYPLSACHKKLLDVCRIRWVECLNVLDLAIKLYKSCMNAPECIKDNANQQWNAESCNKASALHHVCTEPQFLVALHITCQVLDVTRGLTVKLQSRANDLLKAHEVQLTKATLERIRMNVNE